MNDWILFGPEIYYFLAAMLFVCISLTDRIGPGRMQKAAVMLAALGALVCLAAVRLEGELFFKAYRVDLFSQVFKVLVAVGLFLVTTLCTELNGIQEDRHPEFYLLLFTCTLALMMLVSGAHLLTIYISLELSSYSLYILVSLRKDREMGIEAGLKYFLVGIVASAVMLFGFALLYGSTSATYVAEIVRKLPEASAHPTAIVGMLLALTGFFFKLAVFPFHFWVPDAYQGGANQVSAYIATASKVAAIAILTRMVALTGGESTYLVHVLACLSVITMTVGNLAAIVQKDIKRLFAYSSIAHAGYVLIGILSMSPAGYAAALFYAVALLLMKFTAFMVVVKVAFDGKNLQIAQLAGLHRRSPILAMALFVSLFSLAGIPPTIGFTGKFLVFAAAMQKGHFTLVLIAMINVVISLYYYLLALRAAYMEEPAVPMEKLDVPISINVLACLLVGAMVAGGIFPNTLLELAKAAAKALP